MAGGYSKTLSASGDIAIVSVAGWNKPAIAFKQEALIELISELETIQKQLQTKRLNDVDVNLHAMWEHLSACRSMSENLTNAQQDKI